MQSSPSYPDQTKTSPDPAAHRPNEPLHLPTVEPWPEPVDGKLLLDALARVMRAYLVISQWASDALALFIVHILILFKAAKTDRLFTRALVAGLNSLSERFWAESRADKPITDLRLAQQLRPFEIHSHSIRIGDTTSKGYFEADFADAFKRYIPRYEIEALKANLNDTAGPG